MSYETILYEVEERVATITLNRPDRMNAFNIQMRDDLVDAVGRANADDDVRAIVFTGAGRAYCAGADLGSGDKTFDATTTKTRYTVEEPPRDGGGLVSLAIFRSNKPVIGAINGAAVGVGITMTLPMDVRIAASGAKIGFVFARRGLVPEAASSWFLPRVVGVNKACEWTFTGRIFRAEEGRDAGLFSQVLSADEVLPAARAIGREIAENTSAVSVAVARQMFWRMLSAGGGPMDAHRVDSKAIFWLGSRADVKEGVKSFLEKRPPEFTMTTNEDMPPFVPWWEADQDEW